MYALFLLIFILVKTANTQHKHNIKTMESKLQIGTEESKTKV